MTETKAVNINETKAVNINEKANQDALITMSAEIKAQPSLLNTCLRGAQASIEAAAQLLGQFNPSEPLLSIGIGDSHLVGLLVSSLKNKLGTRSVSAVRSVQIADARRSEGILLCNSISGTTRVTLAAAQLAVRWDSQIREQREKVSC